MVVSVVWITLSARNYLSGDDVSSYCYSGRPRLIKDRTLAGPTDSMAGKDDEEEELTEQQKSLLESTG